MNLKKIINIIYGIIFILILVIGFLYVKKTNIKNDITLPKLNVSLNGSSVIINATDNVGVEAYTYSDKNTIPSEWYKANEEKKFTKTLKIITPSVYYIWVKDLNGNISESKSVTLDCSSGTFHEIGDTIYCPYSKVDLYGYTWHVLSDEDGYITLFMDGNQLSELNHCDTLLTSESCYYVSDKEYDSYTWGKSLINQYLNNEFLNTLSNYDIELKDVSVCNDRSGQKGCYDNDGCAGYLNTEVNEYGYLCHNQYTSSKVRLLTYVEYNNILTDLENEDKSWLYGKEAFWTMIGWNKPIYAGAINTKGTFIVDEKTTNKLDVRPVITIKK